MDSALGPNEPDGHKKSGSGSRSGGAQLNMRGVFLHVMADALGSVIVIISAVVMWKFPQWEYKKYVDPGRLNLLLLLIHFYTLDKFWCKLQVKLGLISLSSPKKWCFNIFQKLGLILNHGSLFHIIIVVEWISMTTNSVEYRTDSVEKLVTAKFSTKSSFCRAKEPHFRRNFLNCLLKRNFLLNRCLLNRCTSLNAQSERYFLNMLSKRCCVYLL